MWVPWVTVVESLVQVTVVAGPPVEIQVRVNRGVGPLRSETSENTIPADIETTPTVTVVIVIILYTMYQLQQTHACLNNLVAR